MKILIFVMGILIYGTSAFAQDLCFVESAQFDNCKLQSGSLGPIPPDSLHLDIKGNEMVMTLQSQGQDINRSQFYMDGLVRMVFDNEPTGLMKAYRSVLCKENRVYLYQRYIDPLEEQPHVKEMLFVKTREKLNYVIQVDKKVVAKMSCDLVSNP